MIQTELLELIRQARSGDRRAQEMLIAEVQDRVYYHCKKMLKSESDAQDAAQDVLITVLTNLDKLREPGAFYSWVNAITANRCKHLLTQGVREWQIPEDDDGGSMLDTLENLDQQAVPDAVLNDKETQRLMMEIIDALPPEQRMSVLLYYYDEMSVKEIAQAMEVSEGTVKSRLNYARKSIKAGVEDLEKRGTKLYGLAPLPLVLFLLRQEAAALALSSEQGAQMTAAVMDALQGGAAGAAAGGAGAAASGTAGAAGAAAAKAGLGLGAKIALGIAAAALAGGAVFGGAMLMNRAEEPEETEEPTATVEAAESGTPAVESEPLESQGPSPELLELLDSITYYGDKEACALTPEQAGAYAQVIREEMARVHEAGLREPMMTNDVEQYCAALVDTGGGNPALFFGGGWNDRVSETAGEVSWFDVGSYGIWEYRGGQAVPYLPEGISDLFGSWVEVQEGVMKITTRTIEDGERCVLGLYTIADGAISTRPFTTAGFELAGFDFDANIPVYTYTLDGREVDMDTYNAWGEPLWKGRENNLCEQEFVSEWEGWLFGFGDGEAAAEALERFSNGEAPEPPQTGSTASPELLELLDSIVYYGDREQCRLTPEQAREYAGVITQQINYLDGRKGQTQCDVVHYCAALFDTGNGNPALFCGGGWSYSSITDELAGEAGWYDISICGIWEYRNGRAVRYEPENMEFGPFGSSVIIRKDNVLVYNLAFIDGGERFDAAVYAIADGKISTEPFTTSRYDLRRDGTNQLAVWVDGMESGSEAFDAWQAQWGQNSGTTLCSEWKSGAGGMGWFTGIGDGASTAQALEQFASSSTRRQ